MKEINAFNFGLKKSRIKCVRNSRIKSEGLPPTKIGWTQKKIANKMELTRQRVQQIANNFSVEEICNAYKEGKPVEEIVEKMNIAQSQVAKIINNIQNRILSEMNNDGGEQIDCVFCYGYNKKIRCNNCGL